MSDWEIYVISAVANALMRIFTLTDESSRVSRGPQAFMSAAIEAARAAVAGMGGSDAETPQARLVESLAAVLRHRRAFPDVYGMAWRDWPAGDLDAVALQIAQEVLP